MKYEALTSEHTALMSARAGEQRVKLQRPRHLRSTQWIPKHFTLAGW